MTARHEGDNEREYGVEVADDGGPGDGVEAISCVYADDPGPRLSMGFGSKRKFFGAAAERGSKLSDFSKDNLKMGQASPTPSWCEDATDGITNSDRAAFGLNGADAERQGEGPA